MKSTCSDNALMTSIHQLVPNLLKDHAYGVYELAQECARQLHEPVCEIMTPFCDSLKEMVDCGELHYDRQHNLVCLG
jgi:hypothetical protein